jgi:hypothetical protein
MIVRGFLVQGSHFFRDDFIQGQDANILKEGPKKHEFRVRKGKMMGQGPSSGAGKDRATPIPDMVHP